MGIIFSRWKKKQSRVEVLDKITKDIEWLEDKQQTNINRQKRLPFQLILWSVLLYLVAIMLFYLRFMPNTFYWKAIYSLPFLIFPGIVWTVNRFLHWYFHKSIQNYDKELEALKNIKATLLNEVKETETYNVAQQLLQRFDNNDLLDDNTTLLNNTSISSNHQGTEDTLRRRNKPIKQPQLKKSPLKQPQNHQQQQHKKVLKSPQLCKLPQPPHESSQASIPSFNISQPSMTLVNKQRSFLDKLSDYLLGDGPANRYALICCKCHSHNGLALKEEFEFMTYRCSYCSFMNHASKKKPTAPKIDQPPKQSDPFPSNQSPITPFSTPMSTDDFTNSKPLKHSTPHSHHKNPTIHSNNTPT